MDKSKVLFISLVVGLLAHFSSDFFIYGKKIDPVLVDSWNQELKFVKTHCNGIVPLPTNYVVEIGDAEDAIGYCQHYANGFKIVIDEKFWYFKLDNVGKRQLILHEMMHCVFNVRHNERDSHNFMYPEFEKIAETELLEQAKEVLKRKCN